MHCLVQLVNLVSINVRAIVYLPKDVCFTIGDLRRGGKSSNHLTVTLCGGKVEAQREERGIAEIHGGVTSRGLGSVDTMQNG